MNNGSDHFSEEIQPPATHGGYLAVKRPFFVLANVKGWRRVAGNATFQPSETLNNGVRVDRFFLRRNQNYARSAGGPRFAI